MEIDFSSVFKNAIDTTSMKQKGVTLIEMMVVIAIVGIMTSVTLVSLSGAKVRKELQAAGNELASVLREQRNNALTGNVGTGNDSCGIQHAAASGSSYETTCPSVVSRNLPAGVVFAGNPGTEQTANFSVPFGHTSAGSFVLQKGGSSTLVCFGADGNIYTKESACP